VFANNLYFRQRLKTRVVEIGHLPLGGDHPVRIQSMTNTVTADIVGTVRQSRQLFEAGCDYVRITARNIKEAQDIAIIKKQLHDDGFNNPLIADIHFNPEVALVAARIVEKVRINPGNYVSAESGIKEWGEREYQDELGKISLRIKPLIDVCNEYGTAIRIGTNHGSLSKRILARFGNTAEGMVQSAMEFIRIITSMGFHRLVLSMKSSDIRVMVHAYRLLVSRMQEEGFDYPLHLGVTEAGAREEGIIKSAAGIGALLADGIGDTIRVSLTGDPLQEIPIAHKLANMFKDTKTDRSFAAIHISYDPYNYARRETKGTGPIGGINPIAVMLNRCTESRKQEIIFLNSSKAIQTLHKDQYAIVPHAIWNNKSDNIFPYYDDPKSFINADNRSDILNLIAVNTDETDFEEISNCKDKKTALVIDCGDEHPAGILRYFFHRMIADQLMIPVILKISKEDANSDPYLYCVHLSSMLIDGYGDAVWIESKRLDVIMQDEESAYTLLQSLGLRRTKAEFISCPTCGRTSYNIEKVLEEIRSVAGHLKHLKIAVMGCIVNGPGEMADSDYGCVGSGPGKVNIYKGKSIVKRNIIESEVAKTLLEIIEKDDDH
jgi:(E)-4-hydroxy-3-methylbut-2-enyl-diphosphate synthase